jgi:hypothetical protein
MFTSLRDLEERIGRQKVIELLDRDASGHADPNLVAMVVTDTNKAVFAILNRKGYSADQLKRLAQDESLRRLAAWIGAEFMSLTKTELISADGTTLYTPLALRARRELTDVAMSLLRPQAESVAGAPSTTKGMIFEAQPAFEFTPNEGRPRGSGGF